MPPPLRFTPIEYGAPQYDEMVELRYIVLRAPLGLTFSQSDLAKDEDDPLLLGAFKDMDFLGEEVVESAHPQHDKTLLGCLILSNSTKADTLKMRQVAVLPDFEGLGIGRAMVRAAEHWARTKGFIRFELHARANVVEWYQRMGYLVQGEEFVEVTIPHFAMYKTL